MWFVSHLVCNTGISCAMSWSGCGGISTGIASGQSTSSTSHCNKARALHSSELSKDCCVILANPCASWCSWVGSPSSISENSIQIEFVLCCQYSCAGRSGEVAVVSPKFYGICYLCVSRVPLSMFVVNLVMSGNSRHFCMLPL